MIIIAAHGMNWHPLNLHSQNINNFNQRQQNFVFPPNPYNQQNNSLLYIPVQNNHPSTNHLNQQQPLQEKISFKQGCHNYLKQALFCCQQEIEKVSLNRFKISKVFAKGIEIKTHYELSENQFGASSEGITYQLLLILTKNNTFEAVEVKITAPSEEKLISNLREFLKNYCQ
jgi:hypothetical protein